jgi:hypothetical protein
VTRRQKRKKSNCTGKQKHISPFCTCDKTKTAVVEKYILEFIIETPLW